MKRLVLLGLLLLSACAPSAQDIQTAIARTESAAPTAPAPVVVVTVVIPPTIQALPATAAPEPTATIAPCTNKTDKGTLDEDGKQVCMLEEYYPCLRWDEVTADMKDKLVCVRGVIQRIDKTVEKKTWLVHWDFAANRTGFFALSNYGGWHPASGKDMSPGDCVAITGKVNVLQSGRPYVFWGANSIYHAAVGSSNTVYYEHPDLWPIEDNRAFCQ